MSVVTDLFATHSCTYCLDDIVGIRVKCVECKDFDLCLQCFSSGAEIGPHKNDHDYQFVDPGAVEICKSKNKWTAREQLLLLNGIERYGFGNWDDISAQIKTRTAEEAKEEYISRFVEGSIGRCTWKPALEKRAKLKDLGAALPAEGSSSSVPPIDVTPEQALKLGYMPLRGDFEREYINDAESAVSQLTYSGDDDPLEVALKLAHVDMYTRSLRERNRVKKIARDFQLISKFFADRKDRHSRRRLVSERDVEDKLKPFCSLSPVEEHEAMVRGLERQKELEIRLVELMRYRRAGLTRFEELPHYEQEIARNKGSLLGNLSFDSTEKKRRRRKRGKHTLFHHKKLHAPHRQPFLIRARQAAAAAAARHTDP